MPVIRSGNPRVTLAVLATVVASFSMLQSLVSPALPVIQHDLHTTPGTVTWVFTALLLSVSVATPLLGRIGDMVGKERTLFIALGALAVGCLIAALAPNVDVLIAARVFQGVGGAVFPLAFGIMVIKPFGDVSGVSPVPVVPALVLVLELCACAERAPPNTQTATTTDAHEARETNQRLWLAMEQLSLEQRTVLALFAVDGLSHREIAAVLGIPEGTVWSRLHGARKRLAALLAA